MSLDYRLPEGMTNADLPDDGMNHFAFVTHMMAVGVPDLKSGNLDEFKRRIGIWIISDGEPMDGYDYTIWYLRWYADQVKGMTTNCMRLTKKEFNDRIMERLERRANMSEKRKAAEKARDANA